MPPIVSEVCHIYGNVARSYSVSAKQRMRDGSAWAKSGKKAYVANMYPPVHLGEKRVCQLMQYQLW
jgi:hypothetical protein